MSLSASLERIADRSAYGSGGSVAIRWGQLLRENPTIKAEMAQLAEKKLLISLGDVGRLRGGVVTRANAYFIVRELQFDQIPTRMRMTRADMRRFAVVVDGLDYVCKIERKFLKPVLKGPDSLESVFGVKRTDQRLFDVRMSKDELSAESATGALAYLKRGETVPYTNSSDPLKGGIPATRSQVINRRPYWYSLQLDKSAPAIRIVLPEHHDRRYVSTIINPSDETVIIDKLYSFTATYEEHAALIHAGLNSLLGWYQIELRGRSQQGEGVLELKLPDYRGILLGSPRAIPPKQKENIMTAFARLKSAGSIPSLDELGSAERLAFDISYLSACGFRRPEQAVVMLEQELRALAGERIERKLSVSESKISRRKATNVAATVDAFAARVASGLPPFPDPREFINPDDALIDIAITGVIDGPITVGTELFDLGEVISGGKCVARAGSVAAAQIVRSVLLIEPEVRSVRLPKSARLQRLQREWSSAARRWQAEFDATLEKTLVGVTDFRVRESVRAKAMSLMHAQ